MMEGAQRSLERVSNLDNRMLEENLEHAQKKGGRHNCRNFPCRPRQVILRRHLAETGKQAELERLVGAQRVSGAYDT